MPTGHTSLWHCLTNIHPIATKEVVPIPYSSAPNIDAIIISFPVFMPPSVRNRTLWRKLLATKIWCTSDTPNSHGVPAYLILVWGLAPVPPECPDIKIVSAFAFATPAAIVPIPDRETNFTQTLALGFICFKS